MPSIATIISIYPVAQYLATVDIHKRRLFGGGVDVELPNKIRNIGLSVERIYNDNPSDTSLTKTANYLYALLGKYGAQAQAVSGIAGSIAGVIGNTQSPLPLDFEVTASSFIADGESTKTITAFIGCNIEFTRGGITQNTTNIGASYYTWNKVTGEFFCYPDATLTELFRIVPV